MRWPAWRAADALDLYLRSARPALMVDPRARALFLTRQGTRLRKKVIQYLVRMNARKAEIPQPLSPHQLRHACDSTAIYTRVLPVDLATAIQTAHPREKNWRPKKRRE